MNVREFSKSMALLPAMVCIGMAAHAQTPTNCNYYNTTTGPFPYGSVNTLEHNSGAHQFANSMTGSCTYTGTASAYGTVGCNLTAKANSGSGAGEDGTLTNLLKSHHKNYKDAQGLATSNYGASASADAEGAAGVNSCTGLCSSLGINITGSGMGGGFTVAFGPPSPLWDDSQHYVNNCKGQTLQQIASTCLSPNPPYPPYTPPPTGDTWQWDPINCLWYLEDTNPSPIVIDTTNTGFVFTDPVKGNYVTFDMRGDRNYEKVSWPKNGSGNAWLVYDRR